MQQDNFRPDTLANANPNDFFRSQAPPVQWNQQVRRSQQKMSTIQAIFAKVVSLNEMRISLKVMR